MPALLNYPTYDKEMYTIALTWLEALFVREEDALRIGHSDQQSPSPSVSTDAVQASVQGAASYEVSFSSCSSSW